MYDGLYEEYGKEKVDKVRREMTAKNHRVPSYIELLTELYLRQEAQPKPTCKICHKSDGTHRASCPLT